MHIRRAITLELQEKLKNQPAFAGVWIQRIGPTRNSFPCITLYAEAETVTVVSIHNPPRLQERTLTIAVNAWLRGTPDDEKVEADMDALAVLIESVITCPTLASDCLLVATDFKVAEDEPEIHVITLTYHISYFTPEFNPVN